MNERTRAVYDFIIQFKSEHDGVSPTIREICEATGISSTSVVAYHLGRLTQDGLIVTNDPVERPFVSRSIQVVGGEWLPPVAVGGTVS